MHQGGQVFCLRSSSHPSEVLQRAYMTYLTVSIWPVCGNCQQGLFLDIAVRVVVFARAASGQVDDSRPGRRARGLFLALPDCSVSCLDVSNRLSLEIWPSRVIYVFFSDSAVDASAWFLSLPSPALPSRLPSSPLVQFNARRCPSSNQEQGRVAY